MYLNRDRNRKSYDDSTVCISNARIMNPNVHFLLYIWYSNGGTGLPPCMHNSNGQETDTGKGYTKSTALEYSTETGRAPCISTKGTQLFKTRDENLPGRWIVSLEQARMRNLSFSIWGRPASTSPCQAQLQVSPLRIGDDHHTTFV